MTVAGASGFEVQADPANDNMSARSQPRHYVIASPGFSSYCPPAHLPICLPAYLPICLLPIQRAVQKRQRTVPGVLSGGFPVAYLVVRVLKSVTGAIVLLHVD